MSGDWKWPWSSLVRSAYNFLTPTMALVSGYSSDEDDHVKASSNPFGLMDTEEQPAKRMKLDGPSLKVVAAPDVLAEVNIFVQSVELTDLVSN